MKSISFFLSLVLLAYTPAAMAINKAHTHTESTDSAGTTTTTDKSRDETVGSNGAAKATADEETTVDPKGLNNKVTASSHHEAKVEKNGDYSAKDVTEHADGTEREVTSKKSTAKNWTGGSTTTTTKTDTVDPKGLGNKQTAKVEEKVRRNSDGSTKTKVTKQVNGDTVSDSTVETR